MLFRRLPKKTKIILAIQITGMLMGASTHIGWAIQNGFLSGNYNASLGSTLFWDSLTFLDPLAALLLLVRPKAGVYLTFIIILVDIIHNNLVYADELYVHAPPIGEWIVRYWMILGQVIFALFVFITLRGNLKAINSIN